MNQKIKSLKIIHLALVGGVTLAYSLLGNFKAFFNLEIDESSLPYSFIPAITYVLSNFVFKSMLKKIEENTSFDEKFNVYQTASIVRWAIIEGGCFLILVLKPELILFGVILLIYMILLAPRENQILKILNVKNS